MKKILSIILVLAIAAGFCLELSTAASAATGTSCYLAAISTLCSDTDVQHSSTGFFYDFNKDGVKELVAFYTKQSDPYTYRFSFYTAKKNKAVMICHDKKILTATAPHHCAVGIAKKSGKRYLVTVRQYGSAAAGTNETEKTVICYYKFTGSALKKVKTVYFTGVFNNLVTPAKVKKRTCKIGSKKVSYSQYTKYIKSFSYSKVKVKKDSSWGYYTLKSSTKVSLFDFFSKLWS